MASAKNELQEIYQKRRSPTLPSYSHKQALAEAGWASSLTLPDEPARLFQGFGRTKRDADQEAAQKALEFLNSMEITSALLPPSVVDMRQAPETAIITKPWLILIDLENSPKFTTSRWTNVRWPACRLEAFVGRFSSHAEKDLETLYPFIHTFYVIASGHRDAVDHAISVRAGQWLSCPEVDGLIIISRDRFAAALVDVLRQQTEKEIEQHVNMDRCFDALKRGAAHE